MVIERIKAARGNYISHPLMDAQVWGQSVESILAHTEYVRHSAVIKSGLCLARIHWRDCRALKNPSGLRHSNWTSRVASAITVAIIGGESVAEILAETVAETVAIFRI
jgi:hypothetical protein